MRAIEQLPRGHRRQLLTAEAKRRKTGQWGAWETIRFPKGSVGRTWCAEFETAHKNGVFSVLDRTLSDGTRHLAITSLSEIRPSWPEMQRIKDEIAGPRATAVEVYPPRAEVVDDANMYHLWVLPHALPFTLSDGREPNPYERASA